MKLQEHYQPFIPYSLTSLYHLEERHKVVDVLSSVLMPDDIPTKKILPRKVSGDGNCLFNSASVLITGSEDLAVTLRLLTAAELFLHPDFYANHSR